MESLNDQIWTEEDDDTVSATGDILIFVACLVSCETGSTGNCSTPPPSPYGVGIIGEYCAPSC